MFSDDVRVNFEIDKVFLFPFIEIPFNRYSKEFVDPSVKTVIEKFNTVFHRYFCVMEISGYIIVFTDIVEDFFDRSTNALLAKGYRKIELHNIIPKVINSLSEKFET